MLRRRDDREPPPEYRPPLDDGTGDAQAARRRIIGIAAVPAVPEYRTPTDPPLLTRGQRDRTRHPEAGIDEPTAPVARPARARRAVDALPRRLDGSPHEPARPTWTCQACPDDAPWPCPPARTRLAEAYRGNRGALVEFLSALRDAARDDLAAPPAELRERFLAWTRR